MHFAIVTFNEREAAAIEALFNQVVARGGPWYRRGPDGIYAGSGARLLVLRHHPLNSQGNVVAATCLARLFKDEDEEADFIIFYGCAGVVDSSYLDNVFLVSQVSYASLGTVSPPSTSPGEHITLKNKWMCYTKPKEVEPLMSVTFPDVEGSGTLDLVAITGIPAAHVMATDKVVKVSPSSSPPKPLAYGPPHDTYKKGDWLYADALSYTQNYCHLPLLVEMESYGIGMLAKALKIEERAIIIRVATDSLVDHSGSDQRQADSLVRFNLAVLAVVIAYVNRAWGLTS
jgi:hypothetical protein